jgi:hypothetical protein
MGRCSRHCHSPGGRRACHNGEPASGSGDLRHRGREAGREAIFGHSVSYLVVQFSSLHWQ